MIFWGYEARLTGCGHASAQLIRKFQGLPVIVGPVWHYFQFWSISCFEKKNIIRSHRIPELSVSMSLSWYSKHMRHHQEESCYMSCTQKRQRR